MNSVLLPVFLALAVTSYPATAQQKQKPVDIARLSYDLHHYGVEREAHDRATFPVLMPSKPGQPYNWTTGNALPPKIDKVD